MYFFFFFLYLIAAEFPLFSLLLIRNWQEEREVFLILLLASLVILLILLLIFSIRLKTKLHPSKKVKVTSENLTNNVIIEFLSFFLLPFFTFNISSEGPIFLKIMELVFLLLLLTIFLYRSENLLINPLIFIGCNLYRAESAGMNYTILSSKQRNENSMEDANTQNFIVITNHLLFFVFNDQEFNRIRKNTNRMILVITTIIILLSLFLFWSDF